MDNIIRQTTELAMYLVRAYVKPGDVVIDATCGGGRDTLALARMEPAYLYAFDVQEDAVAATRRLLAENGCADRLSCKGNNAGNSITGNNVDDDCGADHRIVVQQLAHENLRAYFENPGFVKAVIFNLGYLPGGDKTITTKTETTLAAVRDAMELLCPDGIICITMYSGHPEGREEKQALLDFASDLDAGKWHTSYISMPNQKHDPPEILLITRKL